MNMVKLNTLLGMLKLLGMLFLMAAFNESYSQKAEELRWLVGTWTIDTGQGIVIEKWQLLNDSTLSGGSVFVKTGNDTIPQELLELSYRKNQWTYISTVQGQNNNQPVPFKMIFLKGTEFICENPKHDFPQRIAYRRIKHELFASIEGSKNGKLRKENFDYIKVNDANK
jgi:hypothetical protein